MGSALGPAIVRPVGERKAASDGRFESGPHSDPLAPLREDAMRPNSRVCFGLLLALVLSSGVRASALSEQDEKLLTNNLQALSKAWVQEAVDSSNGILWKPEYDRVRWQGFFSGYFAANPFTLQLWRYLTYPVFGWGTDVAHIELQEGLAVSLEGLLTSIIRQHGEHLGDELNRDAVLLDTLSQASRFMNLLAASPVLGGQTRQRLYHWHLALIAEHPAFRASHTIDISRHPKLGWIRAQLQMNLVSFAIPNVTGPALPSLTTLPPQSKTEIAEAIGLQNARLDIWQRHSVLLVDNGGLDQRQLSVVARLLESVPHELYNLGMVTVFGLLGKSDYLLISRVVGCVNIGSAHVGERNVNSFPADVPPHHADFFSLILVHEFNHNVDFYYVRHDNPRRKCVIEQAGQPAMNYLRSQGPDGCFVKAPQEFFASIANNYFASSEHTLELATARFQKGLKEPLNQFLFFTDVYSLGGDSTRFFSMDTEGNLDCQRVPLTRDQKGFISSLRVGPRLYRFSLDEQGNAVGLDVE